MNEVARTKKFGRNVPQLPDGEQQRTEQAEALAVESSRDIIHREKKAQNARSRAPGELYPFVLIQMSSDFHIKFVERFLPVRRFGRTASESKRPIEQGSDEEVPNKCYRLTVFGSMINV